MEETALESPQKPLLNRLIDAVNFSDNINYRDPLGWDTLRDRWVNKTIGKDWREEQMSDIWDSLPDEWKPAVKEGATKFGQAFAEGWQDRRTIEGKEFLNPLAYTDFAVTRGLETIGIPFEWMAQGISKASGLDIELSRIATDFVPVAGIAGAVGKKINKARLLNRINRVGDLNEKIKYIDNLVAADKIDEAIEFSKAAGGNIFFELRGWDSLTRVQKIRRALRQPEETLRKALQGEIDFGPQILPDVKAGVNTVLRALVADTKSGYKSFGDFKRLVLNRLPDKEIRQLYRQLNELTGSWAEGYIEHMVAKGSHMDWYWDVLKRKDRDFVDNVRILFNPRFKNLKDTAEKILYGTKNKDGVFIPSKYNKNPNLAQRLVIDVEDPQKRFSVLKRQNPGDIVIKRAGSGEVIGRLGQYLDILYPQGSAKQVFRDGLAQIGIVGNDAITEWRRKIIQDRIDIIINEAPNLNKIPKSKRVAYIQERLQDDMIDLLDRYDFLPPQKAIQKQLNLDSGPFFNKTTERKIEKAKRMKGSVKQGELF